MSVVISAPPEYLRVHRAPLLDPPFEDELSPAIYRPLILDTASTRFVDPQATTSPEGYTAALHFVADAQANERAAPPVEPAIALAAVRNANRLGQTSAAALRFLNVCLELFNGFRSPRQILTLLHVEHAHAVLEELTRTTRHLNEMRRRDNGTRVRRRQLRTCEPRAGAVEVAAVLTDGVRSFAMCYRLEGEASTWRCTCLRVILPTAPPPKRR